MRPDNTRGRAVLLLAGGAALLCAYLAFVSLTELMPRCPLRWLTGISCPGCGSQRAMLALLHGHPLQAWSYNLLLPVALAYVAALTLSPRRSRLYAALTHPAAIYTLLGVILLWWLVRNLLSI